MVEQTPIFRPVPRRTFELTPASTESSAPPTPGLDTSDPIYLDAKANGSNVPPSRTRSILNLTSSTLFGIYGRTSYEASREENSTPWGTGAQTPTLRPIVDDSKPAIGARLQRRPSLLRQPSQSHPGHHSIFLRLALRTILLFISGVAYGIIITHLHDDQRIAPVKVAGIKRYSWTYLIFWGVAGVGLGSLLPWVDFFWEDTLCAGDRVGVVKSIMRGSRSTETRGDEDERPASRVGSGVGADWNPVVRSIGAFVGIAFAIVRTNNPSLPPTSTYYRLFQQRKLPWQSTLQVSLTLALANPVLWYLIDRSKPGFLLSAVVGLTGWAIAMAGAEQHFINVTHFLCSGFVAVDRTKTQMRHP